MTNKEIHNQAFIDGQNLEFSTTNAEKAWKVDLRKFRVYLERKYSVERAYYFIGFQREENAKIYQEIQEAGYILIFRKHNEKMSSIKKGNVDTDIVFTVMKKIAEREDFDKVILVSGDGDYFKMVDYLIEKDKFSRLLAPNYKRMSSLYKLFDRKYYAALNDDCVRKKIEVSGWKKPTQLKKTGIA
jgi:uncharacterized LabA/DUF88 family protein